MIFVTSHPSNHKCHSDRASSPLCLVAESAISTYGHLVDCYLEMLADRELLGPERTSAVIANKGHYTWIYDTVISDEQRISSTVDLYRLRIK